MAECRYEIGLVICSGFTTVLSDDIVVIYEPLKEYDRLWIIEWTPDSIWFHMSLVEWLIIERNELEVMKSNMALGEYMILFLCYTSAGFWLDSLIAYDSIHICLNIMEFSFDPLISEPYPIKSWLEQYIHRIEKKWHIEYRIEHCDYFACCRDRYQITESYGRRCDHCEVECIEITRSNRKSCLETMNKKCPNEPR